MRRMRKIDLSRHVKRTYAARHKRRLAKATALRKA